MTKPFARKDLLAAVPDRIVRRDRRLIGVLEEADDVLDGAVDGLVDGA
jgi:hypothetical protein